MSIPDAPPSPPAPIHTEARVAVARNAINLVAGQVATTALAVLLSAALGRRLGPADFGIYFLVVSSSQFAYVVVEWGQVLFVVREIARDPSSIGRLLGSALVLRSFGAMLAASAVGLVTWALGYDARVCWLSVAFVLATLPFSLSQAFGMVFRGIDRMGLDAAVLVTNKAALLALAVTALILGAGIPGVVLAQAGAGLLGLAVAFRLFRGVGAGPLRASRETARTILVGGAPILFMMVTVSIQPYLDVIILSRLAPAEVVGWYGAARNVMGTLVAPAMILASAWYPRLSRVGSDPVAFRGELRSAVVPLLWLGALGGIGTYEFADFAIGLIFGLAGYEPATAILEVFGIGLFLLFIDILLGHVVTAAGRSTGFAIAKFASVLVAVGLQLWLIPEFQTRFGNGGIGVVVAISASELVVFVGSIYLMPKGSLDPRLFLDFLRALATAGITAGAFQLLPAVPALVGIPLLVALFSSISMALGLVRRSDVQLLLATVRRGR